MTENHRTFEVSYSSNFTAINESYKNVMVTNKVATFIMPETGGIGLKNYYICAVSRFSVIVAFCIKKAQITEVTA